MRQIDKPVLCWFIFFYSKVNIGRTGQYEQKYLEIDIVQPKPGIHFLLEYDKIAEIETKMKANCEKTNLNLFPP